jgi:uncharacterized protein (UPF0332 family)
VTKTRLQRWLDAGALRRHRTSRHEITDLLAVAERDLRDARVTALSLDRRFATAYSAVLQLATIVLAASGLRVTAQRGHHTVTWQALPELMGDDVGDTAVYFDSCRTLRNRSDYDRVGVVSEAEVEELLRETEAFRGQVIDWLSREHPRFVEGQS